ncbi:hypothetical protein BDA99DRAFT_507744 [Phascolomyces articulosus]|uniref:Uncharacterized protein n=1 Tax=Phascolomyces articulosus TaxID=60185 RepID=A0AAD5PEW0_9FUNG|nr:hypothetical protein BDA99DRAFT_507744 [Phascolomyces articulosus]
MFNAETLDTFCFRWPAFHCYVLVRVLDHYTIALLPFRSRRAFLYFHHAPLPHHPTHFMTTAPSSLTTTPPSIKKQQEQKRRRYHSLDRKKTPSTSSKKIQAMFNPWKHTLALSSTAPPSEQSSINNMSLTSSRSNSTKSSSSSASSTSCNSVPTRVNSTGCTSMQSRPGIASSIPTRMEEDSLCVPQQSRLLDHRSEEEEEEPTEVTLEDVLDNVQHQDQWIQASCNVRPSHKDHSCVILQTFQNKTIIVLMARSSQERQLFLNFVRLNNLPLRRRDLSLSHHKVVVDKNQITTQELIEKLKKKCQDGSAEMLQLAAQVSRAKKEIVSYTDLLNQLDQSIQHLQTNVQEFQSLDQQSFRLLYHVQEQLEVVKANYNGFRRRMHKLDLWLAQNPDIVGAARLRLMLDHVHVSSYRYWFYLLGVMMMGVAIVALWKKNG